MNTKLKILGLAIVCSGYVAIVGCGGGGGGSDGNGNSGQIGGQCHKAPTKCPNGKDADKTESKECPYVCGDASITINTNSVTATGTVTN